MGNPTRVSPKPVPEVLVVWEDGCMMSQRSAHDAGASTSHAALPASDVAVARPEQGRGYACTLPTHLDGAQAERAL
jgi:hypothetical protein